MGRQPQVGDTLGRYALEEELGRGGMAVVFRARDPMLEREVAIKVLHGHLDDDEHARRFVREARAAAKLEHPHILKVHDFGGRGRDDDEQDLPAYIVAELIRGPSLQRFIDGRGPMLSEVAALLTLPILEALGCAHEQGIVHRDVKPDNVMIADGGRIVLADFGIARVLQGESVTQTGTLLGSPAYMSPEQARGEPVDARSDLFSIGTVLYKLCTGRLPFSAPDPLATMLRIVEGKYAPVQAINPRVGRRFARVIDKLLAQDREQRYVDAAAVIADLRAALAEVGVDDADKALSEYFASPAETQNSLATQVVTRSLESARVAREASEHARALALCDRVLAFEPDNSEALALVQTLASSGGGRRRVLLAAAAVLLVVGAVGGWALFGRERAGGATSGSATAVARVGSASSRPVEASGSAATASRGSGSGGRGVASSTAGTTSGTGGAQSSSGSGGGSAAGDTRLVRAAAGTGRRRATPGTASRRRRTARGRGTAASRRRSGARAGTGSAGGTTARSRTTASSTPEPDPSGTGSGTGSARKASTTAKPRPAALQIVVGPWCKASIDGKAVGTSPMRGRWFEVGAGRHEVFCKQGSAVFRRVVSLSRGQRVTVAGLVRALARVSLALAGGDAVRFNGKPLRDGAEVRPGRYRVQVLRGGAVVDTKWLTVARSCTLRDKPRLSCR